MRVIVRKIWYMESPSSSVLAMVVACCLSGKMVITISQEQQEDFV